MPPRKNAPQTISAHCNECGVLFEIYPLDAAQPTQVVFCPGCSHFWKDIKWWTRYTAEAQEAKKATECRWKACVQHLQTLLPPKERFEGMIRHEIEGNVVKVKSYTYLKRDAQQWLQAFHPDAYAAFAVTSDSVYIDPIPGYSADPIDHIPF
jgi:hypothetical protein